MDTTTKQDVLPNGATVIRKCRDVVLCRWRNEYVTWQVDADRNAYWGHYFQTYADASEDFHARAATHVNRLP